MSVTHSPHDGHTRKLRVLSHIVLHSIVVRDSLCSISLCFAFALIFLHFGYKKPPILNEQTIFFGHRVRGGSSVIFILHVDRSEKRQQMLLNAPSVCRSLRKFSSAGGEEIIVFCLETVAVAGF